MERQHADFLEESYEKSKGKDLPNDQIL
jgi:hypothetical protein